MRVYVSLLQDVHCIIHMYMYLLVLLRLLLNYMYSCGLWSTCIYIYVARAYLFFPSKYTCSSVANIMPHDHGYHMATFRLSY